MSIKNNPDRTFINMGEADRYLSGGRDFIDDSLIKNLLSEHPKPDKIFIKDILDKSLSVQTLSPPETAALLNVEDEDLYSEMEDIAGRIKKKVYDNRIVTFAPLYLSNLCINNCLYCSYKTDNSNMRRSMLTLSEIKDEIRKIAGEIGHKRLIIVFGEHPDTDIGYMADTIEAIYSVKIPLLSGGIGEIRRVNVNAPPLSIDDLKILARSGIGTYQVFQETYSHNIYGLFHGNTSPKSNYRWRLYSMHRAMEAGISDVGIGALFGLGDWRFEVMGLLMHSIELENRFGVGPHTISFPRLEPAAGTDISSITRPVSDKELRKIITALRLSVPYTGLIITSREEDSIKRQALELGITQTDASSRIKVGSYKDSHEDQCYENQQFKLGDLRDLDSVVKELADMGYITSFCTAGYRCGRTGEKIMDLLKCGKEGLMCKANAILTFREWLHDFSSEETREIGTRLINTELDELSSVSKELFSLVTDYLKRIDKGERDIYI